MKPRTRRGARRHGWQVLAALWLAGANLMFAADTAAPIAPSQFGSMSVPHAASPGELESALANAKASRESKERMDAKLRGETSLYEAAKLRGQNRIDFLERRARAGDAAAAERLGDLLEAGDGLQADHARAVSYFHAAALGGREGGAHSLGLAYSTGRGIERNYKEALAWLVVAKARGDDSDLEDQLRTFLAGSQYSELVSLAEAEARDRLQAKPKAEEIIAVLPPAAPLVYDAQASAETVNVTNHGLVAETPETVPDVVVYTIIGVRLTWQTLADLRREAQKGDATALDALGRVLLAGKLVTADPLQALDLFEKSAAKGNVDAAYELSGLYSTGTEVLHDDAKAFGYCTQAAKGGVVPAMVNLGVFYTNGRGTERDLINGLAWLEVAKHFGEKSGQESRLRGFMERNRPDDVAKADALAAKLMPEIAAQMH